MNHFAARERIDGRWDYTINGRPWGYCREYSPIPEDSKFMPSEMARQSNEKTGPLAHKYHSCGHDTKEQACECYKEYQLDQQLRLSPTEPENASQQHKCQICKKWTACHAFVGGYTIFSLCPEHQTRESVASLMAIGESWES